MPPSKVAPMEPASRAIDKEILQKRAIRLLKAKHNHVGLVILGTWKRKIDNGLGTALHGMAAS